MQLDFGRTRDDYAAYRGDFAPGLFDRLRAYQIGLAGQTILDVGAGTGLLARELESRGCHVVLADPSRELLAHASQTQQVCAQAELLPFDDNSFDIVTAAQCWHWFDRIRAPREIMRVLRRNGSLAAVYQTYIPLPGSVAEATEHLILKHRPRWRHANSTGVNGQVLRDVQAAGFSGIESFTFDVEIAFTHDTWRGFIRTTSAVGASMSKDKVARFDDEHARMLEGWPDQLLVPHRIFAAVARKPGR